MLGYDKSLTVSDTKLVESDSSLVVPDTTLVESEDSLVVSETTLVESWACRMFATPEGPDRRGGLEKFSGKSSLTKLGPLSFITKELSRWLLPSKSLLMCKSESLLMCRRGSD